MKKYKLTEDHKKQFSKIRDKWIKNAFSTEQIDFKTKELCIDAVEKIYKLANLTPPPRKRIFFVKSPFIARFSAGFSAAIWHLRKNEATYAATEAATFDETDAATDDETDEATRAATFDETDAATYAATDAATYDETYAATEAAIFDATRDATRDATEAATEAATRDATDDETYDEIFAATRAATRAATYAATLAATDDATLAATLAATDDETEAATEAETLAATYEATRAATFDSTFAATYEATDDETCDATNAATFAATEAATRAATEAATFAETGAATEAATEGRWYEVKENYKQISLFLGVGLFGLECAKKTFKFVQSGNAWSGASAFFDFFKNTAQIEIDWSKWEPYEFLSIHTGFRFMHREFCIISEKPICLKVDNENKPHCDGGPFCEWGDGSKLFALNGVRVPKYLAVTPSSKLDVSFFHQEKNADVRTEFIRKYGVERMLDLGVKVDSWESYPEEIWYTKSKYELWDMANIFEGIEYAPHLKMTNQTTGVFHVEAVSPKCRTIDDAIKERAGGRDLEIFNIK